MRHAQALAIRAHAAFALHLGVVPVQVGRAARRATGPAACRHRRRGSPRRCQRGDAPTSGCSGRKRRARAAIRQRGQHAGSRYDAAGACAQSLACGDSESVRRFAGRSPPGRYTAGMQLIEISPVIPAALGRLPELAGNLSYSWHRPTRALFEDLDQELWRQTHSNPRLMLRCVSQAALDAAAAGPGLPAALSRGAGRTTIATSRRRRPKRASRWWRISAPSTASTKAFRSTPAAWASWPATIARRPATSS